LSEETHDRFCMASAFVLYKRLMHTPTLYHFCLLAQELGAAALSKRPTSCMLLLPHPTKGAPADDAEAKEFAESYAEVEKKVKAAMPVF